MKKIFMTLLGLMLLCLTGCTLDSGRYSYSSDEEVRSYIENQYKQKVTFIQTTKTKNGVRYWEFGLENYPGKTFETMQRKNTDAIIAIGDIIALGVAKETFDEAGTNNNIGEILLPGYYSDFLLTLTEEEKKLETAVAKYTLVIRVDTKEQVETAIGIAQKFNDYLKSNADVDYSISCKLKKDFGEPQGELIESAVSEQKDCVTISFQISAADKAKEDFLKRWALFEENR